MVLASGASCILCGGYQWKPPSSQTLDCVAFGNEQSKPTITMASTLIDEYLLLLRRSVVCHIQELGVHCIELEI